MPIPLKLPVEHLLDAFHLLGGQVGRVGVQLQQHFADRLFDQCVVVDRIYVCAVQVAVKLVELLQLQHRVIRRCRFRCRDRHLCQRPEADR